MFGFLFVLGGSNGLNSVYSFSVPYTPKPEALTYDEQNSSYVRVLREGWQFYPTATDGICVNRLELPQDWPTEIIPAFSQHESISIW